MYIKVQPKFKLDHTYHGPYRVYEATSTNVKVKPVTTPDAEAITISLQQVSKCKGNFLANQFWYGHSVTRPRKRRTVKKRNSQSVTATPPVAGSPIQAKSSDLEYRTRYGRLVKPPR